MIITKHGLLVSTALIASLTFTGTAHAQIDDEVIVTATKRETTLRETPIAVSVTSADTIQKAHILDIIDLQSVVPSLSTFQGHKLTNATFSIRGFGNGANNTGIEPSVGVFIDGVYRSRAAAQLGDLPMLERIEVLSGPQSTLFGKNASAGVISVVTAKPSFETQGYAEAGLGNYNQRLLRGYISTGVSDNLAVSLGGSWNKRDGYFEAFQPGLTDPNERNRWNIRGQALFEPTDNVSLRVIADYSKINEVCCGVSTAISGPTVAAIQGIGGIIGDPANALDYVSYLENDPNNVIKDRGLSAHLDIDFDNFALTSITSFRKNNASDASDVDFTTAEMLTLQLDTDIKTFTQELRLTSTGDNKLDWMVGGYYFNEDIDEEGGLFYGNGLRPYFDGLFGALPGIFSTIESLYLLPAGTIYAPGQATFEHFTHKDEAYSLFGSVDLHVNDRLTITGGLSYTNDKKNVSGASVITDQYSALNLGALGVAPALGIPFPDVLFGSIFTAETGLAPTPANIAFIDANAPAGTIAAIRAGANGAVAQLQGAQFQRPFLSFPNSVEDGQTHDDKVTWNIRGAYEVSDNVNVYASVATGFKSSSWNMTRDNKPLLTDAAKLDAAGLIQVNQGYGTRFARPEEATVYELGLKARFDHGSINVAIFDQRLKDFQANTFLGAGFALSNAGSLKTRGFEVDATFTPVDPLLLTFAATYLDAKYDVYTDAPGLNGTLVDLSGTDVGGTPSLSLSTSATYTHEFVNGMTGTLHADYQHVSKSDINRLIAFPELVVNNVNTSVGLETDNGMSVQFWARNLTNKKYFHTLFPAVIQSGTASGYLSQPRTYGVSVRKEF